LSGRRRCRPKDLVWGLYIVKVIRFEIIRVIHKGPRNARFVQWEDSHGGGVPIVCIRPRTPIGVNNVVKRVRENNLSFPKLIMFRLERWFRNLIIPISIEREV
jgi:hypothetical protein